MTWDETVAKYPWVVIDPSSLIGHATPQTMSELADATNPLWRQFYVAWLTNNKGCAIPPAALNRLLADLNEVNRSSNDPVKKGKYETAKSKLKAAGDLEEFRKAIREIKDAVKERAKAEPTRNAGLEFATDAALSRVGSAKPDEELVNAMSNLQNNSEKEALLKAVNDYLVHMKEFFELAGAGGTAWTSVEDGIARGLGNLRTWEASLRIWFGKYQAALPYLQAEGQTREDMKLRATGETVELYASVDSGELVKAVWATISRYGQALASLGVDLANGCQLLVEIAKAQSEADMRKNFAAAFPEAALGLMCAKTAVGVASSIAGFFPPIGTGVAAGLNLAMIVADNATQIIMTKMAKNDPNVVLKQFGKTFDAVPEEQHSAIAEKLGEYGPKLLELLEKGAEIGHLGAELHSNLQVLEEAARHAAEESLKQAGQAVAGVGVVITVGVLAYEWYEFSETYKRDLRNKDGLTDNDVDKLQKGLEGAWTEQASNKFWDINQAEFKGMDGGDYKVVINGIPGKIRAANFVFAPDDRSKVWERVLTTARNANKGGLTFHKSTVEIDWDSVQVTSEPNETGQLLCTGTGKRRSGTTHQCELAVSVEGRVEITNVVGLPDDDTEIARMSGSCPTISDGDVQYTLDWSTAKTTSKHTWYLRCDVKGAAPLPDGRTKTLNIKIQRGGAASVSSGKDDATDDVPKGVRGTEDDKAKVLALLKQRV